MWVVSKCHNNLSWRLSGFLHVEMNGQLLIHVHTCNYVKFLPSNCIFHSTEYEQSKCSCIWYICSRGGEGVQGSELYSIAASGQQEGALDSVWCELWIELPSHHTSWYPMEDHVWVLWKPHYVVSTFGPSLTMSYTRTCSWSGNVHVHVHCVHVPTKSVHAASTLLGYKHCTYRHVFTCDVTVSCLF